MPFKETREGVDFEQIFIDYVERADEHTKATPGFKRVVAEAEETGNYEEALTKLKNFVNKRELAIVKVNVIDAKGNVIPEQNIQQEFDNIKIAHSNPDAFLGNGAVAEVFSMKSAYMSQRVCVKLVFDPVMYAEGNSVKKEYDFLQKMMGVEVSGVRAPEPYYNFSTVRFLGYAMEQLNAVNLSRVRDGLVTSGETEVLPLNFNLEDFFRRLRDYVKHMHTLGIYHGDIALRNIMADKETGLPYLIDFGKARLESEQDQTNLERPDFAKSDLAAIDSVEQELREWLEAKVKKAA